MWTRSLLKKNAWDNLKGYYWPALGVSVLSSVLGGNPCSSGGGGFGGGGSSLSNLSEQSGSGSGGSGSDMDPALIVGIIIGVLVVFVFAMALAMAIQAFLGLPVQCGVRKYFVSARNGDQSFDHMFDNFRNGNYKVTVKSMFSYYIEIFLWSLLFIIPGVIKGYEYFLVPFLIAENPNIDIKRAKEISRQTMDGEKINLWVLQLSFIGWYLLGMLACGLGTIFVMPYQLATEAEFYMCMRAKMLSFGYTSEEELSGGFYNGMSGINPNNPSFNGQYNEPNFTSNAYSVPNDPYQSAQNTGFQNPASPYQAPQNNGFPDPAAPQNPNDQFGGIMPGIDSDQPRVDLSKPNDNDLNNPYNQ